MKCTVIGDFFSFDNKTSKDGNSSFFELRITQENEKGINTEVFPIFDNGLVTNLAGLSKGDNIYLDCDVYVKNGYLQKRVNGLIDMDSGEVLNG